MERLLFVVSKLYAPRLDILLLFECSQVIINQLHHPFIVIVIIVNELMYYIENLIDVTDLTCLIYPVNS
ncbi:hypothetical protein PPL_01066 [Heterostelium album PN500]|uniref:Uncharacterized protein n=1 Tax=Heterostelium pallidum (strain ATCC 26659 / Pp 5 / PN500) TaxID=670386 RepID=D3AY08_HETP5|nr:hypothetical protein PPL_01066 [Heterostelium album PN500]EFA85835.1 hypothetical protein PPL_01066 [Heterostelium album PN500]|eukprot:XP_020437941.1 hypothetical protein PPL_01066 [Heterostelium album PN500]